MHRHKDGPGVFQRLTRHGDLNVVASRGGLQVHPVGIGPSPAGTAAREAQRHAEILLRPVQWEKFRAAGAHAAVARTLLRVLGETDVVVEARAPCPSARLRSLLYWFMEWGTTLEGARSGFSPLSSGAISSIVMAMWSGPPESSAVMYSPAVPSKLYSSKSPPLVTGTEPVRIRWTSSRCEGQNLASTQFRAAGE